LHLLLLLALGLIVAALIRCGVLVVVAVVVLLLSALVLVETKYYFKNPSFLFAKTLVFFHT